MKFLNEIIVAIIGSSLIGFLLTNGLIDYNQPRIRIGVETPFQNSTQKRHDTSIINEGLSAATNLRLTVHYINGNITNFRQVFGGENSTLSVDLKDQATLVTKMPRLAPLGVFVISTIVNDTKAPFFVDRDDIEYRGNYSKYEGSYFISATYDQGGSQLSTDASSQRAFKTVEANVPFSVLVISVIAIALIILISFLIYLKFRKKTTTPSADRLLALIIVVIDAVLIVTVWFFFHPL